MEGSSSTDSLEESLEHNPGSFERGNFGMEGSKADKLGLAGLISLGISAWGDCNSSEGSKFNISLRLSRKRELIATVSSSSISCKGNHEF